MEILGPMFWAALFVLFIQAELSVPVEPPRNSNHHRNDICEPRETGVSDTIFLVIGLGFFVAASLYLFACERL
jgi:hypothetical protein